MKKKMRMNPTVTKEAETTVSREDANVWVMGEEVNKTRTVEEIQEAADRDLHQWILKKGAVLPVWAGGHLTAETTEAARIGEDLHLTGAARVAGPDELRQIVEEVTDPEVHLVMVLLQEEAVMVRAVDLLQWIPRNSVV